MCWGVLTSTPFGAEEALTARLYLDFGESRCARANTMRYMVRRATVREGEAQTVDSFDVL